jgi:hypothetical protein
VFALRRKDYQGDCKRKKNAKLSLQISQRLIDLDQVRVQPVETWAPVSDRFFRPESQNSEVPGADWAVGKAGEALAKKSDRVLADHPFAFIYGKHCSQHPLIFGMRLAKVEVWHT